MGEQYEDVVFCPHCGKETPHVIYESGHERDSSNDWRECKVCGARWLGFTGKYGQPEAR